MCARKEISEFCNMRFFIILKEITILILEFKEITKRIETVCNFQAPFKKSSKNKNKNKA